MSRTDHARRRRILGHRPSTRRVRLYDGSTAYQSTCECCGLRGPLRDAWPEANQDGRGHLADLYVAARSSA